jgi:hypothetical protein
MMTESNRSLGLKITKVVNKKEKPLTAKLIQLGIEKAERKLTKSLVKDIVTVYNQSHKENPVDMDKILEQLGFNETKH